MIHTYTFYDSEVNKLNEFVLAYFNRIEFETGDFSTDFFEQEFYDNLVSRHKGILLKPLKKFYETIKGWDQAKKTALCKAIRDSNDIENICNGTVTATKSAKIPTEVKKLLVTLFKALYKDVLFGKFFKPHYGDRKTHYHEFRRHANNGYENCPACGIRPMHTWVDDITDQYDHYLPKDIYPFSAVNFKNVVPICSDCNMAQVKHNDDILSHTGKVFYPFDTTHQAIIFNIAIAKNDSDLEKIEWQIDYSCAAGKEDELTAWKAIYKIEDRHKKHLRGRINSWYKNYWDNFYDSDTQRIIPNEADRKHNYLRTKEKSDSPFEYKCLSAYLNDPFAMAMSASSAASRY
jgi:hypothetical protein